MALCFRSNFFLESRTLVSRSPARSLVLIHAARAPALRRRGHDYLRPILRRQRRPTFGAGWLGRGTGEHDVLVGCSGRCAVVVSYVASRYDHVEEKVVFDLC